ncbi:hypothetical protein JYU34_004724 [Plutella xylostella]|uniref:Uncharacterized protein n=1 Tax=Plutella xylostella TaxID=51655 RepID=A0ABQ7QYP2_PLUXY|nr:hypothetical protein JYU34_004724 [Plutella xylostella]
MCFFIFATESVKISIDPLCLFKILQSLGIAALAPRTVVRSGGHRGVIGLRGRLYGTLKLIFASKLGQLILPFNNLDKNTISKISLLFSSVTILKCLSLMSYDFNFFALPTENARCHIKRFCNRSICRMCVA